MDQRFSYNEKSQQIESVEPKNMQINACECKPECYDQYDQTVPQQLNPK